MKFTSGDALHNEDATVEDVKAFFDELLALGFNFHPDTDGASYVDGDGKWSMTAKEAHEYDRLMDRVIEICNREDVDYYAVAVQRTAVKQYEIHRTTC